MSKSLNYTKPVLWASCFSLSYMQGPVSKCHLLRLKDQDLLDIQLPVCMTALQSTMLTFAV